MKTIRIITIVLLLLIAINALMAGYQFIKDPSGGSLGISPVLLQHSPFQNFLIPGIILFIVNGIFNLLAALFTLCRWRYFPLMITFQGIILTGWIIIQVILLRDVYLLHYLLGTSGILLFLFGNRLNVGHE